ncbi:MAG TPA: hypothetical protein VLE94_12745 [Burkholderiaceae bacterium]|nr:hypothetical protein [Burkholderiaceae bacterium]
MAWSGGCCAQAAAVVTQPSTVHARHFAWTRMCILIAIEPLRAAQGYGPVPG